jgi:hypothetical protein
VDEGCRWLWVRINALPEDAAMRRNGTWSRADEFAALMLERQEIWGALLTQAWGIKPIPDLIEIRHPDRPAEVVPKKRPTSDPNEIRRFLGRVR